MSTYRFKQVDAFTSRPLFGNPVAVVLGADGLGSEEMQRIAAWTNLSETAFVQTPTTPEGDYRLRIFTPSEELPFAGHPTIGSAHAVIEAGVVGSSRQFVQECGAGPLTLRVEGDGASRVIWARAPEPRIIQDFSPSVDTISEALGTKVSADPPPLAMENGPVFLLVHVPDSTVLSRLQPDMGAVTRLSREFSVTGICAFTLVPGDGPRVHMRWFAPATGVPEDPITGSANATVPAYLARFGLLEQTGREYVAMQGMELGRDGRVHVRVLDDTGMKVEFGGQAVTVIDGEIRL